ncbi:hypothetical protein MSAN_01339500 [Mycena sanguinolenta]|uniref:F-box domain-containing protein n=1 Tax=Mycena sanguinolenta TaxID=230812 RepID=A0A8H6YAI8_9AGAR|nr:hypothetical protein MSAN_01339500 [Mycena sanguinolenta]
MTPTPFFMNTVFAQEAERTRGSSPTLVESDSGLAPLENEIAALAVESSVATFVKPRDRECAGVAPRALVAPICTLPVELLAHIFVLRLTIRESVFKDSLYVRDTFRLSHVCRYWRQIANGTPQLWTGPIQVDFTRRSHPEKENIYVAGLQAWLARSEPLSIPISIGGLQHGSWLTELGSRLTEELLRIAPRCRSLRIPQRASSSLFQSLRGRLDSLEELYLRAVVQDIPDLDPTAITSFTTATRLQKLTTTHNGIPMPWAQLTDITLISQISPKAFLHIFSQCTNVARASIITAGCSVPPARADMITLDHLRIFSVTWVGDQVHYMLFLDCFSAPALDELHMYFRLDENMEWPEGTFTAFQLRSPRVTKLRIEGDGLMELSTAFIAALRHAPSLAYLSVTDCFLGKPLLEALRYTDDVEPLVPHLHSLALAEMERTLSQDYLATMIASRWWTDAELASRSRAPAVARWRQIRLRDDSNYSIGLTPSPKFRDTMNELRETGLNVDLVEFYSWRYGAEAAW